MTEECPLCHDVFIVRCDGAECPLAPHIEHWIVCTDPFNMHGLQSERYEEVVFNKALTPEEVAFIEEHLTKKWKV